MKIRIVPKSPSAPERIDVQPVKVSIPSRPLRVLDFDLECRPLHFYGDYVSKEITAIAWAWTHQPDDVTCYLLGEVDPCFMLEAFRAVYDLADLVTGHFITGFDLPLLNAAMIEQQFPPLSDKLVCDTKTHLIQRHGLSGSQENLGATLGLSKPKVQMNQATWRAANRLTPDGLALVRERVIGDVKQHIELRARLLALGYLKPARIWKSQSAQALTYTP